jgi:hypothetical protein
MVAVLATAVIVVFVLMYLYRKRVRKERSSLPVSARGATPASTLNSLYSLSKTPKSIFRSMIASTEYQSVSVAEDSSHPLTAQQEGGSDNPAHLVDRGGSYAYDAMNESSHHYADSSASIVVVDDDRSHMVVGDDPAAAIIEMAPMRHHQSSQLYEVQHRNMDSSTIFAMVGNPLHGRQGAL